MNRRILLISCLFLGLLLGAAATLTLAINRGGYQVSVSYLRAEASHGEFPTCQEGERLNFAVRNAGAKPVSVDVTGMEDARGNWRPSLRRLGDVEARQSTQLYLYLPEGFHPRNLRVRVNAQASTVRKAEFALKALMAKASGRWPLKQVWFDRLSVPAYEFIVHLGNNGEQVETANERQ